MGSGFKQVASFFGLPLNESLRFQVGKEPMGPGWKG